jgi:hypothetical protein
LTLNRSMLGRRQINATADTHAPLRSSLADAAFAVEERVVWGAADVLRRLFEVAKWPFERAAWAIERGLIWPLEERTGRWNGPTRTVAMAAMGLLAVAVGVFGLLWVSGSGGGGDRTLQQAVAPATPPPVVRPAAEEQVAKAAPVLHGAVPKFAPETGGAASRASTTDASKTSGEATAARPAETTSTPSSDAPTSPSAALAQPAGPAAAKVAHQFAAAFVLYETGQTDAKVREAFAATATPQLAHSLLRRPPRLPADARIPKAKVLNIVPGPKRGDTYTLSVSLLRVGVTSELRMDMQREEKTGEWQVTQVLG